MNYKIKLKLILLFVLILLSTFFSKIYSFNYTPTPTTNFSFELLLEKELEGNIYKLSLGENFYVISDQDENFYLPTYSGFNKYNKDGDLVYKVENQNSQYQEPTNLVLVDNKIVYVTNYTPGYVNVFDTDTGQQLAHVRVYDSQFTYRYPFYNIVSSGDYVFFSSGRPALVYRFNVKNYNLDVFDYKKEMGVYEMYNYSPPLIVDSNKVLFTNYRGLLQLFDVQNIASPIFIKSFNQDFQFLYHKSSASYVPTTYSDTNFFTIYQDYLCVYTKVGGDNTGCSEYTNKTDGEGIGVNNAVAIGDFVYFLVKKIKDSKASYYLSKYSSSFNREFFVDVGSSSNKGGLSLDLQNNILVTGESVFSLSSNTGEVLGTFSMADSQNNIGVKRSSFVSPTSKGNFYVLAIRYDNNKKREFAQIYKFKGVKSTPVCELGFYCDSTPKFRPVILIHGLGGSYQDWFDSKNAVVRQAILQKYQAEDTQFPDDWVYAYSYGYKFGGDYNYQGKIEDISTNLHFDVDRLAAQHKLAGGDGKVDIVAYSLGGLVARHYLLEKTGFPGEQNLDVDHKVGKLILVASPVNGSSGFQIIDDLEKDYPFVGEPIKTKVNQVMTLVQGHPIDLREDIGLQIGSASSYLKSARKDNLPDNIEYYRSYANFIFDYNYTLFGVELGNEINFGDFIVFPEDTFLYGADFTGSRLVEKASKADLVYSGGKLKLKSDLGDLPTIYHNAFIYNEDNINNILNFLSYE